MKQVLRYVDEKSDKFWRIEVGNCELAINWGKTGTTGRYNIKEFLTEDECKKQASKLVMSKVKKGYIDMPDFDAMKHYYFDDEEYGLNLLTSHPIFRTYFSANLYYDCSDEEAPFGSDEGSDTLSFLEETIRKKHKIGFADFPKHLIEEEWDLTYFCPKLEQTDDELKAQDEQELLQTDQVILATAFGQIKIMGKLDSALKELALQSLERMERMYRIFWDWINDEPPYNISRMRGDLIQFINHNF